VISEDMSHIPMKIMPTGMQGMNYNGQLKIMSGIVDVRSTQSRDLLA
jgi:hypothetical protein